MAVLREIELDFVDMIVKSDNEPALTSLIEPWSNLRAMKGGSRMSVESSPVGRSKRNGPVGELFCQFMAWSERCAVHSKNLESEAWGRAIHLAVDCSTRRVLVDEIRSRARRGGLRSKDWKGMMFAEGLWWKRKHACGRTESTWASRPQQVKSSWKRRRCVAHEDGQEEAAERDRQEKLRGKVAMMDKEYQDQLERREHVPVPKRAAHHARKFDGIGFIAGCPGCMSLLRRTARQAHTEE